MARVISFEDHALARLRARLGAAEEAREDLIAFARGHSGAVTAIHDAVLAAIESDNIPGLFDIVTREWPVILGIDCVSLALIVGEDGFQADRRGIRRIAPELIDRALEGAGEVTMRSVGRGHPLLGALSDSTRAEALIAIRCGPGLPRGLLLLGHSNPCPLDNSHGRQLLRFLGRSLGAMIARWLRAETN